MNNLNIQVLEEKIILKKGSISKKNILIYIWYISLISIFFIFFSLKNEAGSLKNIYAVIFINNKYTLWFMKINWGVFIVFLFLNSLSFFKNIYLEEIIIDKKIKIKSISYTLEIDYEFLSKIEVSPFYEANYNFYDRGTFYSHFYDKCTITFITKDERKYKWGYSLSFQKGGAIKNLIEQRIKKKNLEEVTEMCKSLKNI